MQTLTITEAKEQLFQLIGNGGRIEIRHPQKTMVMLPKEEFDRMEKVFLVQEAKEALKRAEGQKRYTTEEVLAMMEGTSDGELDG